jgi:HEAT repeat protein
MILRVITPGFRGKGVEYEKQYTEYDSHPILPVRFDGRVRAGHDQAEDRIRRPRNTDGRHQAAPQEYLKEDAEGKKELIAAVHEALLDDRDPLAKVAAAWALGQIGPEAAEAIPDLIEIIRVYQAPAIINFPASMDATSASRRDANTGPDTFVHQQLAVAKATRMRQKAFGKVVISGTATTSAQEQSTLALANIGPASVPALLVLLRDKGITSTTRRYAVSALGIIGPMAAADSVPVLVPELRSEDRRIRLSAVQALASMGTSARAAIPFLIQDLKENDGEIYYLVVDALAAIRYDALEPLLLTLRDKEEGQRIGAARALSKMGTLAIPGLMQSLEDPNATVRYHAGRALETTGPDPFAAIVRALKDPEAYKRVDAVQALGMLGPKAARAIPGLIEALSDSNGFVRRSAALVLGNLGPAAAKAVPTLIFLLHDPATEVNETAADALKKIGTPQGLKAVRDNQKVTP